MSKNRLDISDSTAVSMPMKNLIAIVGAVAMGVWAYFGVIERLNKLETNTTLLEKDLTQAESALTADIEKNRHQMRMLMLMMMKVMDVVYVGDG